MEFSHTLHLLLPSFMGVVIGALIIKLFPHNSPFARGILVSCLFFLTLRYLAWRTFDTLNFTTKLTGFVSVTLLILEIFAWLMPFFELFMGIERNQRH